LFKSCKLKPLIVNISEAGDNGASSRRHPETMSEHVNIVNKIVVIYFDLYLNFF
jgi:hypothetical protein